MTRQIIGKIHLWVGLALCIPLVVIGLTGSALVFEDELQGPAASRTAAAGAARPAAEIIAAARAAAPSGYIPASYVAPTEPGAMASVRLVPPQRDAPSFDAIRVRVDPVTLATAIDQQDGLLRQIFFVHSTLLLKNRDGRQLVGWLGVVMLAMGISGLVNWWPRRGQWGSAFAVTRGAQGFRLHRELHGAAGIWGLTVFLTVSFAGVYLAFPEAVRGVVDLVLPSRDIRAQAAAVRVSPLMGIEPIDVDAAIALARADYPGARASFVFLPMRPDRPFRIAVLRGEQDRRAPAITVIVDQWSRRVTEAFDPRQFSLGERILAWQHAVHAGQALGGVWKLLVFLSGFLPLLFALTGPTMWWLKRRRSSMRAAADLATDQASTVGRAAE
jgi:uncharacterized iron-regulated membrane protein